MSTCPLRNVGTVSPGEVSGPRDETSALTPSNAVHGQREAFFSETALSPAQLDYSARLDARPTVALRQMAVTLPQPSKRQPIPVSYPESSAPPPYVECDFLPKEAQFPAWAPDAPFKQGFSDASPQAPLPWSQPIASQPAIPPAMLDNRPSTQPAIQNFSHQPINNSPFSNTQTNNPANNMPQPSAMDFASVANSPVPSPREQQQLNPDTNFSMQAAFAHAQEIIVKRRNTFYSPTLRSQIQSGIGYPLQLPLPVVSQSRLAEYKSRMVSLLGGGDVTVLDSVINDFVGDAAEDTEHHVQSILSCITANYSTATADQKQGLYEYALPRIDDIADCDIAVPGAIAQAYAQLLSKAADTIGLPRQ
jgi:hypothetical protein